MQFAQECVSYIIDDNRIKRNNYLGLAVYTFGQQIMRNVDRYNYGFHGLYHEGYNRFNVIRDDKFHLSQKVIDKLPFIASYVLHRASLGWCMVSMDLDSPGRTLLRKKCENDRDVLRTIDIVDRISILGHFMDFRVLKDPTQEEGIVTISFPTSKLPNCRELGLMF